MDKPAESDLEANGASQPPPNQKVSEIDNGKEKALIAFSIAGYATCSSLMLVVNKVRKET
jgi:hypothetical protein